MFSTPNNQTLRAFTSHFVKKYLLYLFKMPLFYFSYPIYSTPHIPFSILLLLYLYIIILFFILIFFFLKQNSRCTLAVKIHQKIPTAIKPIANSTYQKPNHNNNNSQIQHTKNPFTTTTIHKFSISKTQTQQQYINSTHNNIPKTHWIQTSQHSKNQSTKTHFNIPSAKPIFRRRNPKPKAQTHFTVEGGATQIPNLKPQTTASTRPQPKQQRRRSTQRPNWPPQTTSTLATHGDDLKVLILARRL